MTEKDKEAADREKFVFPERGFFVVVDKIAEADFFLEKLKTESSSLSLNQEYNFYFSAFVSSARSITFSLQWVMSKYPDFDQWYLIRQQKLRDSSLAKFFVNVRNCNQKTGLMPIFHSGYCAQGEIRAFQNFYISPAISEVKDIPIPSVTEACEMYLKQLLIIISECYLDFSAYINPNTMFTEKGLEVIGWSIEDLEEILGFPKGYTDVPWDGDYKNDQRLKALRRYGGDDIVSEYFEKYQISYSRE